MQLTSDPRRADRERRFKPPPPTSAPIEDLTTDYMNILGMLYGPSILLFYLNLLCSCLGSEKSGIVGYNLLFNIIM